MEGAALPLEIRAAQLLHSHPLKTCHETTPARTVLKGSIMCCVGQSKGRNSKNKLSPLCWGRSHSSETFWYLWCWKLVLVFEHVWTQIKLCKWTGSFKICENMDIFPCVFWKPPEFETALFQKENVECKGSSVAVRSWVVVSFRVLARRSLSAS